MTFLYKSKEGIINLAGLVISNHTGVELPTRVAELESCDYLVCTEIKYEELPIEEVTTTIEEVPVTIAENLELIVAL